MALIPCPECNNQVSTKAVTCPHCGYPLQDVDTSKKSNANGALRVQSASVQYETKTEKVVCWGLGGTDAVVEDLAPDLKAGWEIVSIVENYWRGGALRHVYSVVLKRPINNSSTPYFESSNQPVTPEAEEYLEYSTGFTIPDFKIDDVPYLKKWLVKYLIDIEFLPNSNDTKKVISKTIDDIFYAAELPKKPKLTGDQKDFANNILWAYEEDVLHKPTYSCELVVATLVRKFFE